MMNRKTCIRTFFLVGVFLLPTIAFAQKKIISPKDTITDDNIVIPEMVNTEIDLSLITWFGKKVIKENDCSKQKPGKEPVTEQDYMSRLAKLPTIMEMPYNQIVRQYIDMYARRKGQVSSLLGLSDFYFPIFEEELAKNSLPIELKYLPIIESALNPVAMSRAGAAGLWQFIYSTGKIYGMEINSFIDERRDPLKSTKAAVRYLKDLYDIYQDWHLVIAAYNCGPGNVNKAIRRANGQRDYWAIYNYLPRETRGYVPTFIAAVYIMNYYNDHSICPSQVQLNMVTDTVHINEMIHFQQIADVLSVPVEEIKALNPQYKFDIIPGNVSTQIVRLPMDAALAFYGKKDSIRAYRADDFLVNNRRTVGIGGSDYVQNMKMITHRVKRGETIARVAMRYDVSVADIKDWNNLSRNTLKSGQRLRIFIRDDSKKTEPSTQKTESAEQIVVSSNSSPSRPSAQRSVAEIVLQSDVYTDSNQPSSSAKAENNSAANASPKTATQSSPAPKTITPKTTPEKTPQTKPAESKKKAAIINYKVKEGDTLYKIAKKTGVSVDIIKKTNKLSSNDIRTNQILKIPAK
ncbi:MAG: transglycosylase SLT domain-containing protein [Bacteroidales bacterium]|jgi:membrane-bound lytic murein transglycosylase D|nr:transglycosylase SLT domain-containing protein [Bacteroidales bacterium]